MKLHRDLAKQGKLQSDDALKLAYHLGIDLKKSKWRFNERAF